MIGIISYDFELLLKRNRSNLEEISKNFNVDKNKGNQFFYDQTKID